ncbi:hypothetical protein RUND412_008507, partial [Rhizina undulata]
PHMAFCSIVDTAPTLEKVLCPCCRYIDLPRERPLIRPRGGKVKATLAYYSHASSHDNESDDESEDDEMEDVNRSGVSFELINVNNVGKLAEESIS